MPWRGYYHFCAYSVWIPNNTSSFSHTFFCLFGFTTNASFEYMANVVRTFVSLKKPNYFSSRSALLGIWLFERRPRSKIMLVIFHNRMLSSAIEIKTI